MMGKERQTTMDATHPRLRLELPHEALAEFCRRNQIRALSVFGSALRDDFTPDSDVDFLVEFEPDAHFGYIGLAGIEAELGDLIGRKADLNPAGPIRRGVYRSHLEEETIYVAPG